MTPEQKKLINFAIAKIQELLSDISKTEDPQRLEFTCNHYLKMIRDIVDHIPYFIDDKKKK